MFSRNDLKHLPTNQRIAWICLIIAIVRIIFGIPVPFINRAYLETMRHSALAGGMIGLITGASFKSMSLFALSISPYITASIVIQLLSVAIPPLGELPKEGKQGEEKYKRITNMTAVGIGFVQALFMTISFGRRGLIMPYTNRTAACCVALWTIGVIILNQVADLIDYFHLGKGISWLLLANIVSTLPNDAKRFFELYVAGRGAFIAGFRILVMMTAFFGLILLCTVMTTTVKKIPVTFSGKLVGNISEARSVFPIPLITCSVMPIIFAGNLTSIPAIASQLSDKPMGPVGMALQPQNWFVPGHMLYTLGAIAYFGLTCVFTFFYLEMSFNAWEIAAKLKEEGGVMENLRPGEETARYLEKQILPVAMCGNVLLTGLVIGMQTVTNLSEMGAISMGSTSSIIAVAVMGELMERLRGERAAQRTLPSFASIGGIRPVEFHPVLWYRNAAYSVKRMPARFRLRVKRYVEKGEWA